MTKSEFGNVKTPDLILTSICGIILCHVHGDSLGDMVQPRLRNIFISISCYNPQEFSVLSALYMACVPAKKSGETQDKKLHSTIGYYESHVICVQINFRADLAGIVTSPSNFKPVGEVLKS